MKDNPNNNETISKVGNNQIITDFGTRAIHSQNFSKMVALPKIALANCGIKSHVNVQLVYENGIKYIKLIPFKEEKP